MVLVTHNFWKDIQVRKEKVNKKLSDIKQGKTKAKEVSIEMFNPWEDEEGMQRYNNLPQSVKKHIQNIK